MNDKKKWFPLFVLANLAMVIFLGAASGSDQSHAAGPLLGATPSAETTLDEATRIEPIDLRIPSRDTAPAVPAPPSNPWVNYPNVCETFNIIQSTTRVRGKKKKWHYPVRYKRNRYKRAYSERRRTRKLVEFVAEEMGVTRPEFFAAFAMHESTWNPEAIHILNPDLQANQRAWTRHTYTRAEEFELEEKLAKADAQKREYWRIKSQLADIRLYKGNTHWHDRLAYDYIIPEHTIAQHTMKVDGEKQIIPEQIIPEQIIPEQIMVQSQNVWGFGYGLYGHYSVGYVKNWDSKAPPWILCAEEGILATIVQVWAARANTAECDALTAKNPEKWGTDGGSYRGVLRRLAKGRCSNKRLGKVWRGLIQEHSTIPWEEHAEFGLEKWSQWEMKKKRGKWVYKLDKDRKKIPTDRQVILAHMVKKARAKGLMRPAPLELHHPERTPHIVPGTPEVLEPEPTAVGGAPPTAVAAP